MIKNLRYTIFDCGSATDKNGALQLQYNSVTSPELQDKISNYKVTLEFALVWSRNTPSVTIFQALGARKVAQWARRFGFTTPIIPDKALALGASCVRMDEMNAAFAVFARNGRSIRPVTIRRIRDASGRVVEDNTWPSDPMLQPASDRPHDRPSGIPRRQAIPAKAAYLKSVFRKVITDGHNETIRTSVSPRTATGTAYNTMDTWFSGYTSRGGAQLAGRE